MVSAWERQERPGHEAEQHSSQKRVESHDSNSSDAQSIRVPDTSSFKESPYGSNTPVDDQSNELPIHYVSNGGRRRHKLLAEDEPLVDTTAALALHSKKTARLQKRQQEKQARKVRSDIQSFLDLPQELLSTVLSFLLPTDIFNLLRLCKSMRAFVLDNERSIADNIMSYRYWVLRQCFPLPVSLERLPSVTRPALMSKKWQERLLIHQSPYQHIKHIDPSNSCTCGSCILAWHHLNIILDLAHWQQNLETREPLPIMPPGRNPEWNVKLVEQNAEIVTKAMKSPLIYARILQTHLKTTTCTIIRSGNWMNKGEKITIPKPRLYHLTDPEAAAGTDEYLERSGRPSSQPIFMRDDYYSMEAFVPNRRWDKEEQKWHYYAKGPRRHENALNWLVAKYTPKTRVGGLEQSSNNVSGQEKTGATVPEVMSN